MRKRGIRKTHIRYWSSPTYGFPIQFSLVKTGNYLLFCSARQPRLKDILLDQITRFETDTVPRLCILQANPNLYQTVRILMKVRRSEKGTCNGVKGVNYDGKGDKVLVILIFDL